MKQKKVWRSLYLVPVFLAFCLVFAFVQTHHTKASINPYINFQGKLTNPDGTNLTNGSYSIVFSIYTVASGGSNVWTETKSVTVTDGIFQTSLGDTTALPGSVNFNTGTLYLGIKVAADAEMTPRVMLTAAPYAFNSDKLGGIANTGLVQLGQSSSAQTDGSTNPGIIINKTSTGNQVQLQASAVDVFTVTNGGDITFGQNANKVISVTQTSTNAGGKSLTLTAGQGGTGASANAGGGLILQGGAGGGTNGVGGDVTVSAGAGSGSGAVGSVIVKNSADATNSFQVQDSTSVPLFVVDTTFDRVYVGNPTSDGVGVLLVLDTKNTAGDPTGVNGGSYYNSDLRRFRCYSNGVWADCQGIPTPNNRRTSQLIYPGSGTVFSLVGDIATAGTAGTAVAATTTTPAALQFSTAATLNTVNHVSGNTNYDTDNRIRYQANMAITVNTIVRVWAGITNQTAATMSAAANPAGNYAAFRFDTGAGDANYQCVTKDNVTPTVTNSGVAPGTGYRKLEILQSSSEVVFFIDGTRVCTNTTNLPAANTLTRYANTVTTLEGVIKRINVAWIYIESDY